VKKVQNKKESEKCSKNETKQLEYQVDMGSDMEAGEYTLISFTKGTITSTKTEGFLGCLRTEITL
jgi:hypothetical protein